MGFGLDRIDILEIGHRVGVSPIGVADLRPTLATFGAVDQRIGLVLARNTFLLCLLIRHANYTLEFRARIPTSNRW